MATQKQSSAREQIYATGRRKTSSARVFMRPGGRGELFVNGKPLTRYFTRATAVMIAKQAIAVAQSAVTKPEVETAAAPTSAPDTPLAPVVLAPAPAETTETAETAAPMAPVASIVSSAEIADFDFFITVRGGGESGQAEAVRHGMARAFVRHDPSLKPKLRAAGLIRRDSREVERKKTGLLKARRARQYSKR